MCMVCLAFAAGIGHSRRGIWDIDRSLVRNKSIGPLHSAGNGHASLLTNINLKARNRKLRLVTSGCEQPSWAPLIVCLEN